MKRVIVGSIALSFAAGAALAQTTQPPASPPGAAGQGQGASAMVEFKTVDSNKDGRISSTEAQSNTELRSAFATLDADRDNYLSQTEYNKWSKASKSGSSGSSSSSSPNSSSSSSPDSSTSSPRSDSSSGSEVQQ